MTVKRMKVETYITKLYCDKCGAEITGPTVVLASMPPKYLYDCPKCGETIETTEKYPSMEYVEVEDGKGE